MPLPITMRGSLTGWILVLSECAAGRPAAPCSCEGAAAERIAIVVDGAVPLTTSRSVPPWSCEFLQLAQLVTAAPQTGSAGGPRPPPPLPPPPPRRRCLR